MKIYLILLTTLSLVACKKTEIVEVVREIEPEEPIATHTYYSYVADEIINAEKLGYTSEEFTPGCCYAYGDTLFIANTQKNHYSIILYSRSKHQKIGTLNNWNYNGEQQAFNNYVEALSVSNGRLYAANIGSSIDVFDVTSLSFITRIGKRNYGYSNIDLFHSHAMAIVGDYIVVRMKNCLQVHLQTNTIPTNYQKVPFYARGTTDGFDTNNGFYSHQMVTDSTGTIYLADYGQAGNKKIQIIDTALIQPGDNQILTHDQSLSLDFNPRGIALYKNLMYISANDGSIRFYNRDKKEFFHTCKSVTGYTFKGAQKLLIIANRLWVTDIATKEVIGVDIYSHEIEEYHKINAVNSTH